MSDQILITRPDDWHAHLRDGNAMADVLGATARDFARAIVMPTLNPPVVAVKKATAYRDRTLAALPKRATFEAAACDERGWECVVATITARHRLLKRNAIFAGGINPHHYCMPVLKREPHRRALLKAAPSGSPKFFLGTDSAPHPRSVKESCCGSAGVYTAHAAIELYAEAFESAGRRDQTPGFSAVNRGDLYRPPGESGQPK